MERRRLLTILSGALLGLPLTAGAQNVLLYEGRVQWIAGSTLVLMTDEGWSVRVDLTRAAQSEYSGLGPRDRIIVSGVISQDGNYVIGLSIRRGRSEYQSP